MRAKKEIRFRLFAVFMAVLLFYAWTVLGSPDDQPVLRYYWVKAEKAFTASDSALGSRDYAIYVRSFYRHISRKGKTTHTDTSRVVFYYSAGQLDSQVTKTEDRVKERPIDISLPNLFKNEYVLSFFPNDTGGKELAIAFDHRSASASEPSGTAIIDRNSGLLRWLYTHYPNKIGYKRYSRSFRLTEHDGYVSPDSVWEVGTREGVFTNEYYRIETKIDSLVIVR
ncbi:MAG: hypothetical protein SGI97_04265 [candidate division Zixibacteria bacterium]|nr:hypothetical protein [candidate division Zixibacteria bacterium]